MKIEEADWNKLFVKPSICCVPFGIQIVETEKLRRIINIDAI
ncbi:hypothetical protein [Bacillus andreraoultii]|nr:hypothetical protein [Bacillus andreraoultii]